MSKVIFVLVEAATTEINEAIKVYSALQKSEKACIWLRYRLHAMHMPRQLVKRGKFNFGIFFGKYSSSNEFQLNRKSQKQTKIVDTSAVCRSIGRGSANWIGLDWVELHRLIYEQLDFVVTTKIWPTQSFSYRPPFLFQFH